MKHLAAILALAILLTIGLACSESGEKTTSADAPSGSTNSTTTKSDSSNGVTVDYVTMKNADDETVTSFKPTDRTQKIAVQFSETNVGKVRGVFTATDAGGEKNFKILEKEIELGTLMNTGTFTMTLNKDFPVGDYKLDVYVNGRLIKTHDYKVQ